MYIPNKNVIYCLFTIPFRFMRYHCILSWNHSNEFDEVCIFVRVWDINMLMGMKSNLYITLKCSSLLQLLSEVKYILQLSYIHSIILSFKLLKSQKVQCNRHQVILQVMTVSFTHMRLSVYFMPVLFNYVSQIQPFRCKTSRYSSFTDPPKYKKI